MCAPSPQEVSLDEQSLELFYEHDFTSDQIRWHGAAVHLLGWDHSELPDSHTEWFRFIHPDDLPVLCAVLSNGACGSFSTQFRVRQKDGHYVRVRDRGVFYRDPQGSVTRRIGTLRPAVTANNSHTAGAPAEPIREVLDSLFVFVVVLSTGGRIIEVNNAPVEAAGMKREDVLGKDFLDTPWFAGLPETLAQVERMIERVAGGEIVREDFRVRFKGEVRVVDATFSPLRSESGEITRIVGSSVDVTDRKETEERLRQLGRQHEMILNAAGEGICGVDREGRATFVNQAAARMLGYQVHEMIGRQILPKVDQCGDCSDPDPDRFCPIRAKVLDGKSRRFERDTFRHKDGTDFPVEYTSDPIYEEDLLVGAVVVFSDITLRLEAEEARRESDLRFRQVVENIRELFWISDLDRNELYMSSGFEQIWGAPRENFGSAPFGLLETVHPDDRARVETAMNPDSIEHFDQEFRIVRPDGTIRWIRSRIFPVKNEQGVVYRFAGLTEDITEGRRLNEQLRQSQKLEAVGLLASGVAHDFNNLLTVIQGNASLLLAEVDEHSSAALYTRDIIQAAEQSAAVTRQLLLFSSRQAMQQKQLQINEVVADVVRMLQRVVGEDVTFLTEYSPKLPLVYADSGMIEQIVLNLAVNSRDAMPRGGRLLIATRLAIVSADTARHHRELKEGTYVCVSVSDTGHGIPPEILPRIFEPFFTTKQMGKGTGLGLATVYGIVRQHHGWVDVQSKMGEGTTVQIWLPAIGGKEPDAKRPLMGTLPTGTETILVVEDEPALRLVSDNILRRCGYEVLTAVDGDAALEVWRQNAERIDLLLTDMVMPGQLTGRELAHRLGQEKPDLKVLFTSGYSADVVGKDSIILEGSNLLPKPYHAPMLAKAVRDCLDGRPLSTA